MNDDGRQTRREKSRSLASADPQRERFLSEPGNTLNGEPCIGAPMTKDKAYQMGYRHIIDLAEMNRVAEMADVERLSAYAAQIMDAWREGALAAKAMLEKEVATLQ